MAIFKETIGKRWRRDELPEKPIRLTNPQLGCVDVSGYSECDEVAIFHINRTPFGEHPTVETFKAEEINKLPFFKDLKGNVVNISWRVS